MASLNTNRLFHVEKSEGILSLSILTLNKQDLCNSTWNIIDLLYSIEYLFHVEQYIMNHS